MPRRKRPDPSPTFQATPFQLDDEVRCALCEQYLVPDQWSSGRARQLAEVFNRGHDRRIVEPTLDSVQARAIERIEAAVGEYRGAVKSGNASLSERGKKGAPEKSARHRLVNALMSVVWLFYHGICDGKAVTKAGWNDDRYAYLRLILDAAKIKTPSARDGHPNSELREWIEPLPHNWVDARNDIRKDIYKKADDKRDSVSTEAPDDAVDNPQVPAFDIPQRPMMRMPDDDTDSGPDGAGP